MKNQIMVRLTFFLVGINFILWNVLMPVFEPADESGHYAHILYIWKQRRLPSLVEPIPTEKGVGYTTYPPFYYWTLIPLAKLVDAPLESEELLPYHPQKELFKKGVYAVYLHTKDELLFKWNRLMLSVHLLRLQTSVYGLLTVYLVYLTGKRLFGKRSLKPLAVTVLVGLNPMFAHISNSIVNVNLNILLFSLFFYMVVGSFVNFPMVKFMKLHIVLGVIAGLAYLTKITGLVLILIWFLYTIITAIKLFLTLRGRVRFMTMASVLFLVGFLTVSGWYLVRNYNLYGSFFETSAAIKHFGRPAMQLEVSGPINYWIGFIQTNFKTFFSGYGMLTVNLPDKILFLLLIIALIGIWGNFIYKKDNPLRSLLKGSSLIVLMGHIFVNINVEAFHARDLFIGMVPFSLLFVDGVSIWLKELRSGKLWSHSAINYLMFSAFLTISLFHFLQPNLVNFAKFALFGFQIFTLATIKMAGFTVAFYLLWLIFKRYNGWTAEALVRISSNKNFLWIFAGGLFASNILILIFSVIPKLYRL